MKKKQRLSKGEEFKVNNYGEIVRREEVPDELDAEVERLIKKQENDAENVKGCAVVIITGLIIWIIHLVFS